MTEPDSITEILFKAASDRRLFDGNLLRMCPKEEAAGSLKWHISSQVPAVFLKSLWLARPQAVVTSDVLGITDALAFWVIGYQVGTKQHRFLLPLVGADVQQLITDLPDGGVTLDLQANSGQQTYSARVPVSAQVHSALMQAVRGPCDVDRVLQETLLVTSTLLQPRALMPAPGVGVPKLVSVTGVLPAGLLAVAAGA